jgi:hypothetical protein
VGYNNNSCRWDSTYNYCYESSCWDFTNLSACESATGLNCKWRNSYCSTYYCSDFDFTNASACENNSVNLDCKYNSPYCNQKDCWSYTDQNSCTSASGCQWETDNFGGWCEEIDCWKWDYYNGGNRSICLNNASLYGLDCVWEGFNPGNETHGWCFRNWNNVICSNKTSERSCIDTYYCVWDYSSETCLDPADAGIEWNNTVFDSWNPGCYIFDTNLTECGKINGCDNSTGVCLSNATISAEGLKCGYINDSVLCNSIASLSNCCVWQNGTCEDNFLSTACWDNIQAPPDGGSYCEDWKAYTDKATCDQIAGAPWYMPCRWNNKSTVDETDDRCEVRTDVLFGNATKNLAFFDGNKQGCERAGGGVHY